MTHETSFRFLLEPDVALRVQFSRDRGQVIAFVVQLECYIIDSWYPVIRYDTAHGYAHCDILRPDGSQEKRELSISSFNDALTYAQRDLRENHQYYCERFREQLL